VMLVVTEIHRTQRQLNNS